MKKHEKATAREYLDQAKPITLEEKLSSNLLLSKIKLIYRPILLERRFTPAPFSLIFVKSQKSV